MTVLIEVRTPAGNARRCDATCHYATTEKCTCVCGGKFHGRGAAVQDLPPEALFAARVDVDLNEGESMQLRFGA